MHRTSLLAMALGALAACSTPAGSGPDPSASAAAANTSDPAAATSAAAAATSTAPTTAAAPSAAATAVPAAADPAASGDPAAPSSAGAAASGEPVASSSASAAVSPGAAASASAAAASSGPCPAGMIFVRGGTFKRRKPGERASPTVRAFCMDRAEVTVLAYKECVKEKKCSPRCLEVGRCTAVPVDADWPDKMETIRASMFCNGSRADRDDHPVNCVSFEEAKGFCAARDKRLPTGDEWEWAVAADKPAPIFPWGPRAPEGTDLCWGKPYRRSLTCLPGTFPHDVTRDGLVDMAGNLSEWVVRGTPEKPRSQLRGASWYSLDDGYVQAAIFGFESTSTRSEVFGFRCAKDAAAR